ncbi:hypothetical protein PIB30_109370, partial [Stylosanthes scabra]|nr:hypothetical protein [Stylosanthes scabra]
YLGEGRDGFCRKQGKPLASRSREGRGEGSTFNFIDRSAVYHSMLEVPELDSENPVWERSVAVNG